MVHQLHCHSVHLPGPYQPTVYHWAQWWALVWSQYQALSTGGNVPIWNKFLDFNARTDKWLSFAYLWQRGMIVPCQLLILLYYVLLLLCLKPTNLPSPSTPLPKFMIFWYLLGFLPIACNHLHKKQGPASGSTSVLCGAGMGSDGSWWVTGLLCWQLPPAGAFGWAGWCSSPPGHLQGKPGWLVLPAPLPAGKKPFWQKHCLLFYSQNGSNLENISHEHNCFSNEKEFI